MRVDADFLYGVSDAVKKLRPNAVFEITNTSFTKWEDPSGLSAPSWDEIMEQVNKDELLYTSLQYARSRKSLYPKLEDQLDDIWHAINSGVALNESSWFKGIEEIKEKYPKP